MKILFLGKLWFYEIPLFQPLYIFIVKILCTSKLKLAEHLTSMVVLRTDQQQAFF